jgi:hypothetical protein
MTMGDKVAKLKSTARKIRKDMAGINPTVSLYATLQTQLSDVCYQIEYFEKKRCSTTLLDESKQDDPIHHA